MLRPLQQAVQADRGALEALHAAAQAVRGLGLGAARRARPRRGHVHRSRRACSRSGVTDVDGAADATSQRRDGRTATRTRPSCCREDQIEIVVRTIEAKTGLATTHHVRRAALDANEYQPAGRACTQSWPTLAGTPPFHVKLGEQHHRRATRSRSCATASSRSPRRASTYYRFKGLGEMDPDELRETTMDPASRTLVQVTMEDAASADLRVLDADGRPGRAAPRVHRGERPPRDQPGRRSED